MGFSFCASFCLPCEKPNGELNEQRTSEEVHVSGCHALAYTSALGGFALWVALSSTQGGVVLTLGCLWSY